MDPSRERCSTFYHVVNRVVDRRFVLGDEEKEKFRMFLRMAENFSGCRVLSYCVMSNHFHVLLEVPPQVKKVGGFLLPIESDGARCVLSLESGEFRGKKVSEVELSEEQFFGRLRELYSEAVVEGIREQVEQAKGRNHPEEVARIFARYAYRMHDLSEFMKTLTQRFSSWFNRSRDRKGRLWEQRFKSVIVQDGIAARTMAAYIDLNPVRAGMVQDAADYRWSSYGEAVAGGKKARAGLVRALGGKNPRKDSTGLSLEEFDFKKLVRAWSQAGVGKAYRRILLGKGEEKVLEARVVRKGMSKELVERKLAELEVRKSDLAISEVVRHRVRYFSDGVVLGGKDFVEEVFQKNRSRFGPKRETGARKPRGALRVFEKVLWTARDLRKE